MPRLSIGFFSDFADPTLLIWGSSEGLDDFAQLLLELGNKRVQKIKLTDLDWVKSFGETKMCIEVPTETTQVLRPTKNETNVLTWRIAAQDARSFAELIRGVAESPTPCHAYLDSESQGEIVVMVSKGEYDDL